MRNLLLFILISASKIIVACGFYPYGEDTRISLFNPKAFGFYQYADFYFSSNTFEHNDKDLPSTYIEPNTKLWFDYCKGKVEIPFVEAAIYNLSEEEIDAKSQNEFIIYLHQQKDKETLNYLRFAKKCEFYNSWQDDPWEKESFSLLPKRKELMNKAIELSKNTKNQTIKKRYVFLAIRLAWYNQHFEQIKTLFASTFEKATKKDILYYWSLYFKSFTENDLSLANYELAQVFAHAIDKRFVCHQHYKKDISIDKVLQHAKTNEEKANVYLLAGIEKPDKALIYLQKMHELNPGSDGLSFLLLREINKIEDFVLTPYYTLFEPSLELWNIEEKEASVQQIIKRSENDRIYAKEVLQFINAVDINKVSNSILWNTGKAYLQFISRDYSTCLASINKLEKTLTNEELNHQLQFIKALALTANQTKGKANIPIEIQEILMSNKNNEQLIFVVGKELEYLENTSDAAILYSRLTKTYFEENSEYTSKQVYWKTTKNKGTYYSDFYTDYFDYTDVVFTPEQTELLIEDIRKNKNEKDSFSVFKYEILKDQIPRLYDLLGTKYIRQNKLKNALIAFEKAGQQYWNRAYTSWEENENIFDQNPFYTLKYTPSFIEAKDKIRLNKFTVTKQLITYLEKAENKNEKDRDYYYFLVANAYYNMGCLGNVYMMRRMGYWSAYNISEIEDEHEFRQSNLAKQYYLLAKQYSKTEKFKALCLRMVVRCEKNKIEFKHIGNWGEDNYNDALEANIYYLQLKSEYPKYFDDLVSNCDNFGEYFEKRR